jgi:hypothetical protein
VLLVASLVVLSASFYASWFLDGSHPVGGWGWFDQSLYTRAAWRIADGNLPTAHQLHYAPFYSMLGAAGSFISHGDPFWIVSYALLVASAIFLYRGCQALFGDVFATLFLVLTFWHDGTARSFNYASELFAVPWNNQMLFFAYAFFFWLFTSRARAGVDARSAVMVGAVVGTLATTREESVLFCVPLAAFYLWNRHATVRQWSTAGAAAVASALPGLIIKQVVLGSFLDTARGSTYGGAAGRYLSLERLGRNLLQVVVDSDYAAEPARRLALLESSPWMWLAVVGLPIVLLTRRYGPLVKWWVVMSGALVVFYLAGRNMSAVKLKFHCLRYISPGFIALNFGVVVTLATLWEVTRRRRDDVDLDLPQAAADEPALSSAIDAGRQA